MGHTVEPRLYYIRKRAGNLSHNRRHLAKRSDLCIQGAYWFTPSAVFLSLSSIPFNVFYTGQAILHVILKLH